MKTIHFTSVIYFYLVFLTSGLTASTFHLKYDSLSCLEIEGKITNLDAGANDCFVELISKDGILDSIVLKEGKRRFKFVLKRDTYYAIRITKKGFVTKLISINTEVPTDSDVLYRFQFDTELMNKSFSKRLNKDALDFPVAIICFDYEKKFFFYDKQYSANVKRDLYSKN